MNHDHQQPRGTKPAPPYLWASKSALRRIREALDREGNVGSGLAVYLALCESASNAGADTFATTHGALAALCGFSPRTVRSRLAEIADLGLIVVSTPLLKCASTYSLLAFPERQPLPNDGQPLPNDRQRQKKASLPPSERTEKQLGMNNEKTPLPPAPDAAGQSAPAGGVSSDASLNERAEEIYSCYPRKVGKPAALQKIRKSIKEHDPAKVLAATKAFAAMWQGEASLQYCPHPATWYGQERFNDDPATWKPSAPPTPTNRVDRNIGTLNEGNASKYANVGKRQPPANAITTRPPEPTTSGVGKLL